jgi:hypothetical protein
MGGGASKHFVYAAHSRGCSQALLNGANTQVVAPAAGAWNALEHLMHTGSPAMGAKLPAAQGLHAAAAHALTGVLPAGHLWHAPAAVLANVPGPQGRQWN